MLYREMQQVDARLRSARRVSESEVPPLEREFFVDKLLVRTNSIIEMILVDLPCTMGV